MARDGKLYRDLDREGLRGILDFPRTESVGSRDVLKKWKGLLRNERTEKQ